MAVLRIQKKQKNFVILDKTCLNDKALSWGAKGLHAYLMSLPDDWAVRVSDLQVRSKNGRDAVRGLLKELEQAGYIQTMNCRDETSGRFGGIEYLVVETPEPEKPSLVNNEDFFPEPDNQSPENPATGNPCPANPTLLSINRINNNKLNNKTAAKELELQETPDDHENAAAVTFSKNIPQENSSGTIHILSQDDAVITSELTNKQIQRIESLLETLPASNKAVMFQEISFCLLNKAHFTACGSDFSKKLNAIRLVILRGDWQTPSGMAQKDSKANNPDEIAMQQLNQALHDAYAEVAHFQKLLPSVQEKARAHLETIIHKTQNTIDGLQKTIKDKGLLFKKAAS